MGLERWDNCEYTADNVNDLVAKCYDGTQRFDCQRKTVKGETVSYFRADPVAGCKGLSIATKNIINKYTRGTVEPAIKCTLDGNLYMQDAAKCEAAVDIITAAYASFIDSTFAECHLTTMTSSMTTTQTTSPTTTTTPTTTPTTTTTATTTATTTEQSGQIQCHTQGGHSYLSVRPGIDCDTQAGYLTGLFDGCLEPAKRKQEAFVCDKGQDGYQPMKTKVGLSCKDTVAYFNGVVIPGYTTDVITGSLGCYIGDFVLADKACGKVVALLNRMIDSHLLGEKTCEVSTVTTSGTTTLTTSTTPTTSLSTSRTTSQSTTRTTSQSTTPTTSQTSTRTTSATTTHTTSATSTPTSSRTSTRTTSQSTTPTSSRTTSATTSRSTTRTSSPTTTQTTSRSTTPTSSATSSQTTSKTTSRSTSQSTTPTSSQVMSGRPLFCLAGPRRTMGGVTAQHLSQIDMEAGAQGLPGVANP